MHCMMPQHAKFCSPVFLVWHSIKRGTYVYDLFSLLNFKQVLIRVCKVFHLVDTLSDRAAASSAVELPASEAIAAAPWSVNLQPSSQGTNLASTSLEQAHLYEQKRVKLHHEHLR